MSIDAVSAAASSQAVQESGQGSSNAEVQSLIRLEQNVQKMKSDLESKVKLDKVAPTEVQTKIKEYDKLIAQIEQQIQQMRQEASRKAVRQTKKAGRGADPAADRQDRTALSVAALNASYQSLPFPTAGAGAVPAAPAPAPAAEAAQAGDDASETESRVTRELNQLA